jgi:hypothetical protein
MKENIQQQGPGNLKFKVRTKVRESNGGARILVEGDQIFFFENINKNIKKYN